jgi:hypothetical protein
LGRIYDDDGTARIGACDDSICRSILESALVGGFICNSDAQLVFTTPSIDSRLSSSMGTSDQQQQAVVVSVPIMQYTATMRVRNDRLRYLDADSGEEPEMTEITEGIAVIKCGDILYLPLGRDDLSVSKDGCEEHSRNVAIPSYELMMHAPSKWCAVKAIDLLFARMWVYPCSSAPAYWFQSNDESDLEAMESRGYWLPLSLLWDAVVFSPMVNQDDDGKIAIDIVRNGVKFKECR